MMPKLPIERQAKRLKVKTHNTEATGTKLNKEQKSQRKIPQANPLAIAPPMYPANH
jgi:hypothetical protein